MDAIDGGCTLSSEASQLINAALRAANQQQVPPSSHHLLLAICQMQSVARSYLQENDLDPGRIVAHIDFTKEPELVLEQVWIAARSLASQNVLTSLHLLAGLLRYHTHSNAVRTLREVGVETTRLRNTLISQLTQRRQPPRQFVSQWDSSDNQLPVKAKAQGASSGRSVPSHAGAQRPTAERSAVARGRAPGRSGPSGQPGSSHTPSQGWPSLDSGARAPLHSPPAHGAEPRHSKQGFGQPGHPMNAPNPYLPSSRAPQSPPSSLHGWPATVPKVGQSYPTPPHGVPPQAMPRPQEPPRHSGLQRSRTSPSSPNRAWPANGAPARPAPGAPRAEAPMPGRAPSSHSGDPSRSGAQPPLRRPAQPLRSGGHQALRRPGSPGRSGVQKPPRRPSGASPGRRGDAERRDKQNKRDKRRQDDTRRRLGLASKMRGRFGTRKPQRDPDKLPRPSMQDLADSIFQNHDVPLDEMKRQLNEDLARLGEDLGESKEKRRKGGDAARGEVAEVSDGGDVGRSPGAVPPRPERSRRSSKSTPKMTVRAGTPLSPEARRRLEMRYELDAEEYPFLSKLGRNLSLQAVRDKLDDLVGRDKEIERLTDILNKRRSNNPLLVGPPGVGKTAIVEGLALELVHNHARSGGLSDRIVIELEMGRLLSGTQLRGSFSERLIGLKDEVAKADGQVIIFLDEIHTWIGAGASGDGGADAAGELKAALARGRFPCIGATTSEEYSRYIESDPAFRRRFQVVEVEEPNAEDCVAILQGVLPAYSEHHKVTYTDEAVEAAVRFSQRYIPEERLPDKAIGLLDLAGSRAQRQSADEVSREVVAEVVAARTGVPLEKLLMRDKERFLRMEEILGAGIIGHHPIIRRVCEVIRRNYAGFHSGRPIGSFLFLGPTGVGKTEMVKVLADFLFRDREAIVRLDMSEYRESHAVARLIGAPPGYVGHEHGGQLTEAIRKRPYQIVLMDEVEKAHPEVLNILLQLLDDGRLTDGKGRTVNFSNVVVIMTSNLGSDYLSAGLKAVTQPRIGFGAGLPVVAAAAAAELSLTEEIIENVIGVARGALSPELWNRIEERLVFGPLTRSEVARIARLQLRDSARRLAAEKDIYLEATEAVFEYLIDHGGYDPALGARPMRQTLQRLVEVPISEMIIAGGAREGDHVCIDVVGGELSFGLTDR